MRMMGSNGLGNPKKTDPEKIVGITKSSKERVGSRDKTPNTGI